MKLIARMLPWLFAKPIVPDRPTCSFCGQVMTEQHNTAAREASLCLYPVWRCPCGAIGSGAWPPDVDEVADQLLQVLGIDGRVSHPAVPISESISAQYYDSDSAVESLSQTVGQHGYHLRINTCREHSASIRCLWVRKA